MTIETQTLRHQRPLQRAQKMPNVLGRLVSAAQRNPVTIGLAILGAIGGALAGIWLPIDKPLLVRVVGGAITGGYFALFPLGARLLQGDD